VISEHEDELIDTITDIVHDVFHEDMFADRAIERFFRQNRITDDTLRETIAEGVYQILRLGGYIKEVNKSDDIKEMTEFWYKNRDLLNALVANENNIPLPKGTISVNEWMDAFASQQLGENYELIFSSFVKKPTMYLRTNSLVTTSEKLIEQLNSEDIIAEKVTEDTLKVPSVKGLFRTKAYTNGQFEVQDFASQKVTEFCDVQSGMRIIDACAGAGGKSLHLAAIMKNKGRILALDIYEDKLEDLKIRARRAKASIIEPRLITSSKTIKRLDSSADRVLLDAPCSGSGVYRRNPDAKWRLTEESINSLIKTQDDILARYSRMTKTGGYLIYAVCSVFPCEGEDRVRNFISSKNGEYELIEEKRYSPIENCDGFYMAKIKRLVL